MTRLGRSSLPVDPCRRTLAVLQTAGTVAAYGPSERRRAREHVDACPACASFLDDALAMRGTAVPATGVARLHGRDDPAGRVLGALAHHRPARRPVLAPLLATAAILQLLVALPWVVGRNPLGDVLGHASVAHLTRDGALGVTVGVSALVAVVRRPATTAMLWVVLAVTALQIVAGLVDRHGASVTSTFEASHVLTLSVVAGLVALGHPAAPRRRQRPPELGERPTDRRPLRAL